MRTHVTIIAWLNILLSLPTLLVGLLLCIGSAFLAAIPFIAGFGVLGGLFFIAWGLAGIMLGWGLLNYAPWARVLGIIVSIINLLSFHTAGIGIALGIYSLIILFNRETAELFEGPQRIV